MKVDYFAGGGGDGLEVGVVAGIAECGGGVDGGCDLGTYKYGFLGEALLGRPLSMIESRVLTSVRTFMRSSAWTAAVAAERGFAILDWSNVLQLTDRQTLSEVCRHV